MRTALVCHLRQSFNPFDASRQSGAKKGSSSGSSARGKIDARHREKPNTGDKQNHRAKARKLFEG
jgi:hypothetical protein